MRHRVHERFPYGTPRQKRAILANDVVVGLGVSKACEPAEGALDLVVHAPGGIGDLKHVAGAVLAGVGDALDSKVPGLRVPLRLLAERQYAVQRGIELAIGLDQYTAVAEVRLAGRLRRVLHVESLPLKECPELLDVDVRRSCGFQGPFLGQDVAEQVVEFLEFARRGLDGRALPPHPHPTGVAQRLEPALTRTLDPMQPARGVPMRRASGGDRTAATRLEELRETFLNGLVILTHPDDLARVVDAEHNDAAFRVGECADGATDGREVSQSTFELRRRSFAAFEACQDFRCVHG